MAILIKDSFNRANSTSGLGQTETGQNWQTAGSIWGIQNNQAYPINNSVYTPPYVTSPKINNIAYEIRLSVYTSDFIIFWKFKDISNLFTLENGVIAKIVGGTVTVLANFTTSLQNNDLFRIEIRDNNYTIFLNGSQIATFTDSSNYENAGFGFTTYGNPSVRYDDFLIEDLSSPGTNHTKMLVETISISENTAKIISSFRAFSESITTNDEISKRLSVFVADTIATNETENENTNKKTINDFIPINDTITISNSNTRSINLNDSIVILDSISKQLSRNISDNVDLVETENRSMFKSLVDNIALSDSILTFGGKTVLLTDSITVTDSISTTKQLSRLFTESINVSDGFTKQSAQSIKLYDVIVTSDSVDIFNPDAPNLIGVIHLRGKRELFVYLQGKRELTINLQGKRELIINLKGGLKMVPNQNFNMISGDTKKIIIDIDEILVNVSVKWAMKKRGTSDIILSKEGYIADGKIYIDLDPEDTMDISGIFSHECEVTDQNNNISTVLIGAVNVMSDMI